MAHTGELETAAASARLLLGSHPDDATVQNVFCDTLVALARLMMISGCQEQAIDCIAECLVVDPRRREEVVSLARLTR
ncbi:MAG: hypothetical protein ACAI34_05145 [Verrucomicrobium sp.]